MGQYYKPISLNKEGQLVNEWVLSHDYNNGLKLMEHSWLGNDFVSVVETLLIPGGKWYKKGIVWAGDYADEETDSKTNLYSRCKDENKINPIGIVDDDGDPTRLALAANAWGEPVPRTAGAAARLAAKGRNLLEKYKLNKDD